ncbi:unnamed protein product [Peniophora sp. CBMAI 1063]|nr:unnamed protein product [Peniophora sp. CBMAI 1063]
MSTAPSDQLNSAVVTLTASVARLGEMFMRETEQSRMLYQQQTQELHAEMSAMAARAEERESVMNVRLAQLAAYLEANFPQGYPGG